VTAVLEYSHGTLTLVAEIASGATGFARRVEITV
jgi:hypothetical protein